jgi:beta-lactamase regulating signal transducer with metallopeptidase domain
MFATQWLTLPSSRLITLTLLHFLWQGLAVALLLQLLVEACRIRRAGARYACSLVALLVMVIAPIVTLGVLMISRPNAVSGQLGSVEYAAVASPVVVSFWASWLTTAEPYLLAAWLCGVAVFGSRLLSGAIGVARLRRSCLPIPAKLRGVVDEISKQLRMDAQALVYLSEQVTDAMAVGLVRPLVLIPAAWVTEMPLDMLEAVIAHELAHLARRDLWVNLLQRMVETVLFYHPAVWWLSRRLRMERELCADELAVSATGKR